VLTVVLCIRVGNSPGVYRDRNDERLQAAADRNDFRTVAQLRKRQVMKNMLAAGIDERRRVEVEERRQRAVLDVEMADVDDIIGNVDVEGLASDRRRPEKPRDPLQVIGLREAYDVGNAYAEEPYGPDYSGRNGDWRDDGNVDLALAQLALPAKYDVEDEMTFDTEQWRQLFVDEGGQEPVVSLDPFSGMGEYMSEFNRAIEDIFDDDEPPRKKQRLYKPAYLQPNPLNNDWVEIRSDSAVVEGVNIPGINYPTRGPPAVSVDGGALDQSMEVDDGMFMGRLVDEHPVDVTQMPFFQQMLSSRAPKNYTHVPIR